MIKNKYTRQVQIIIGNLNDLKENPLSQNLL
jgi:hypothetical protein